MRLLAACVLASLSAALALWLAVVGSEAVRAPQRAFLGRDALMALLGYVAYGWPLALLAILVVGLPVYSWLRRSGRLDRRTVQLGAAIIGALALPAIGSIAGGDGLWGQPLLYGWGALAGFVAGTVFARLMRVGSDAVVRRTASRGS